MPSLSTVESFIALVEAGRGLDAMERYYAANATMQENNSAPRVGKEALLENERAAQAAVTDLRARCIRPILVAGDTVVLRWIFEYTIKSTRSVRFEELAYQRWKGDQIIEEQFFYDPAQFK